MVLRTGVRIVPFVCLFAAVLPAQQDRIVAPIDARHTVVMRGSAPGKAQPAFDRGAVEPDLRLGNITLLLNRSGAQQAALEELLARQQDPASPDYHHWLTPETYAGRFGVSAADMEKIAEWLRSEGFAVTYTARGRDFISFAGTAAQAASTLRTEIHRYQVGGKTHYANATDISLPAALAPLVASVAGLNDFHPRPAHKLAPDYTAADGTNLLLPDDFATIYDVGPLYNYGYTGAGQNIVIVGQSDIDPGDIATFRAAWDMPGNPLRMVPTGNYPGIDPDDEVEADLDLEWAGAVARFANLVFVYSDDVDYSAYYAIDNNLGPVISESFGICETGAIANGISLSAMQAHAHKANALGNTWLAASGDAGAAVCDPDAIIAVNGFAVGVPASLPEVTAVGGTEYNEGSGTYWSLTNGPYGGSALSYIPEMAWNDTVANGSLAASSGGRSVVFVKPSWQSGLGVPNDGARDVPDVAFNASDVHDPYVVVAGGGTLAVGGTSASTPAFAGVLALLNQFLVQNKVQSQPGLGNINPKLYSLAASSASTVFHDVTVGNNIVPCQVGTPDCTTGSFGYTAGPGYDLVTGWGSVDAYNLITTWANLPVVPTLMTVSASQSTIDASGSTVLTATVKAASGTISPTGMVSFTLAGTVVGSAPLSGSGGSASASITIFGSQLTVSSETVQASYSGGPTFSSSSAATTIKLGTPAAASAVTVSVTPNPVYQQPPAANGAIFSFTIQLKETAGVATTVTGFTFGGVSYTTSIPTFFGSATLPAHGTLTAKLQSANIVPPVTETIVFTGRDASGATWSQQASVSFLPQQ